MTLRDLGLDFETAYGTKYSLTSMTTMDYVKDERFRIHGVGLQWLDSDDEPVWYGHEETYDILPSIDWSSVRLIAHNAPFDAYILNQHMNLRPAAYADTAAMLRAVSPNSRSSLKEGCIRLWPDDPTMRKGEELAKIKDIWELDPEMEQVIAGYCREDVRLMNAMFRELIKQVPETEMQLINIITRMFVEPSLILDVPRITKFLTSEKERAHKLIEASGVPLEVLSSNAQFAELLEEMEIPIPVKLSPTALKKGEEKLIPALGKNDLAFQDMKAENREHQHIWDGREAAKSRINETRAQRFLDAMLPDGRIPAPLRYSAAHTHRLGGTEKLNMQNLPRKSELRYSLLAPKGSYVYVADLSQIEARLNAWLAGETELLEGFANNEDIYSIFASRVYGFPVNKDENPDERFVGKTCLAASTRVLTRRGFVPIVDVTLSDELWDGAEWVRHQGVSFMGRRQTISLSGVELTPDHEILTAPTKWEPAVNVLSNEAAFQSALSLATLPSLDMSNTLQTKDIGVGGRSARVAGAAPYTPTTQEIYEQDEQLPVTLVQKEKHLTNVGGNTKPQCRTTSKDRGFLIAFRPPFLGAITPKTKRTNITDCEAYKSAKNGGATTPRSSYTFRHSPVGTVLRSIWTGLTTIVGMNRVTSGLRPESRTPTTNERSRTSKPVYDILNAGSRNRFTILTDDGPIIVHNCILGLGYQMGAPKFRNTMLSGAQGPPMDILIEEAIRIVRLYRSTYSRIARNWQNAKGWLYAMMDPNRWGETYGPLTFDKERVWLPNGLCLHYPNLRIKNAQFIYDSVRGTKKTYGGNLIENIIQALARIVIMDGMRAADEYFRGLGHKGVVLQVHDENIALGPVENADEHMAMFIKLLTTPPAWCPDAPIAAEGGYAVNYSK
jgi:hypothetical protein